MNYLFLLFATTVFFEPVIADTTTGALEVNITGLHSNKGKIHIALYDNAEAFPKEGRFVIKKLLSANQKSLVINGLSFGNYAIAAFHDENDNGKLDKNIFGIPTEPYAFSNNARPKWKRPTFEETVFSFYNRKMQLKLSLCKWKDL